jgi:hypothetical protein
MTDHRASLASKWLTRLCWAVTSAITAAVVLAFFGTGALPWNTTGYWLFVAAVSGLAFVMSPLLEWREDHEKGR